MTHIANCGCSSLWPSAIIILLKIRIYFVNVSPSNDWFVLQMTPEGNMSVHESKLRIPALYWSNPLFICATLFRKCLQRQMVLQMCEVMCVGRGHWRLTDASPRPVLATESPAVCLFFPLISSRHVLTPFQTYRSDVGTVLAGQRHQVRAPHGQTTTCWPRNSFSEEKF